MKDQTFNEKLIEITVAPEHQATSDTDKGESHLFHYTITIKNLSDEPVKLLSRHWLIKDANQAVQEVRGEGVVGQTPTILPDNSFTYTSSAVIHADYGTMEGSYTMQCINGSEFEAPIPLFPLVPPRALH